MAVPADGGGGSKFRKVALPGTGASAPPDHDVSVERAMMADMLRGARAPAPPTAGSALAAGDTLTMTLLKRLAEQEEAVAALQAAVAAKDREIASLQLQVRGARAAPPLAGDDEVGALRAQVADMEAFLRDYGLVWVGGPPPAAPAHVAAESARPAAPATAAAPAASPAPPVDLDFPVLLLRLNQLNALVGAGTAKVVKRDGVHKFEVPPGTPLTVYRNGFMLNRGPFRPYHDAAARAFIQVRGPERRCGCACGYGRQRHAHTRRPDTHPPHPLLRRTCTTATSLAN